MVPTFSAPYVFSGGRVLVLFSKRVFLALSVLSLLGGCDYYELRSPAQIPPVTSQVGNGGGTNDQTFGVSRASVHLSETTVNFGVTESGAGSTQSLSLTNSGSGPATGLSVQISSSANLYSVTGSSCGIELAAGSTCEITLGYSPQGNGPQSGEMTLAYFDGASVEKVQATLQGTEAAKVSLVPLGATDLAEVLGLSASVSFQLANSGQTSATLSPALTGSGHDFTLAASQSGNSCGSSLAPGASCSLTVVFQSAAMVWQEPAVLNVSYSDGVKTVSLPPVTLTGTATPRALLSVGVVPPASTQLFVGETRTFSLSVVNAESTPAVQMQLTGVPSGLVLDTGAPDACGATLAGGDRCTFSLKFAAGAPEVISASVVVSYFDGVATVQTDPVTFSIQVRDTVAFTLNGESPLQPPPGLPNLQSGSFDFGSQPYGETQARTFVLVNPSKDVTASVDLSQAGFAGPFAFNGAAPGKRGTCSPQVTLPPGGSCSIDVSFGGILGASGGALKLAYRVSGISDATLITLKLSAQGVFCTGVKFGTGGFARGPAYTAGIQSNPVSRGLVSLPDGKVLVSEQMGLLRLACDGSADPVFGVGGLVTTRIRTQDVAYGAGIYYAVGQDPKTGTAAVESFHDDGTVNVTFGPNGNGLRTDAFGYAAAELQAVQYVAGANGGFIVAAGDSNPYSSTAMFLASYSLDGKSVSDVAITGWAPNIAAAALQVVNGSVAIVGNAPNCVMIGYTTVSGTGTLGSKIDAGCFVRYSAFANDIAFFDGNWVVAGGGKSGSERNTQFTVWTLPPGSFEFDSSHYYQSQWPTSDSGFASALAVNGDQISVFGQMWPSVPSTFSNFFYGSMGAGVNGNYFDSPIPSNDPSEVTRAVYLRDGRLLVSGLTGGTPFVARFLANGQPDM